MATSGDAGPKGWGGSAETAFEVYWMLAAAAFLLLLRDVWESIRHFIELSRARGGSA